MDRRQFLASVPTALALPSLEGKPPEVSSLDTPRWPNPKFHVYSFLLDYFTKEWFHVILAYGGNWQIRGTLPNSSPLHQYAMLPGAIEFDADLQEMLELIDRDLSRPVHHLWDSEGRLSIPAEWGLLEQRIIATDEDREALLKDGLLEPLDLDLDKEDFEEWLQTQDDHAENWRVLHALNVLARAARVQPPLSIRVQDRQKMAISELKRAYGGKV